MNKLQLSLLAIGAVVILAVLAFNRWQERKYRRQTEARFPARHEDVLLKENVAPARREPVLDDHADAADQGEMEPWLEEDDQTSAMPEPHDEVALDPGREQAIASQPVTAPEPELDPDPEPEPAREPEPEPAPSAATPLAGVADPDQVPDPATEYVVALDAADPVSALALARMLREVKNHGKPVRWLGHCTRRHTWNDVFQDEPGAEYVKLAACMQLADRNGPVRADELDAFCRMAQAVAANLYAVVDCPDRENALILAAELDQFCADVDVLIGINVISRDGGVFAGTKLRGLAESAGMKLMPDGGFHYINDQGADLFSLTNQEPVAFAAESMKHLSTHGVTFLFDVPKAVGGVQAYNHMMLVVKQFVAPLGALVVDDNRRELSDSGIDKIRQQLVSIYQRMDTYGIGAGSPRARRLFA